MPCRFDQAKARRVTKVLPRVPSRAEPLARASRLRKLQAASESRGPLAIHAVETDQTTASHTVMGKSRSTAVAWPIGSPTIAHSP
jgi:hypothetical protein